MVIRDVKQLDDRVKFTLYYSNGVGIPDESSEEELLYERIPNLEPEPALLEGDDDWYLAESLLIESIGVRIAYHFHEWQETVQSKMITYEGGPYLARKD